MATHTLSICTGYGGIELGLREVVPRIRNLCYVENEITQAKIVAQRIKEGRLEDAPIWSDLRTFDATPFRGKVDILTGGFPCQPHSVGGKRRGADDPRELSSEVLRIADELGRPTLFLENVPGIKRFYWDNIRPKLRAMGYRTEEVLVTASETGAPHKRQRLFILANAGLPSLEGWYDELENGIRTRMGGWSKELQSEDWFRRSNGTAETERSDSDLVYANDSRDSAQRYGVDGNRETQNKGRQGQSFPKPTGQSTDVVNPISRGAQESATRGQSSEQERNNSSETVGNPFGKRLQGRISNDSGVDERHTCESVENDRRFPRNHVGYSSAPLPIYPPQPTDIEGWKYMYSEMPSAKPTFCRDANGSTPWVDERLRSIGNGVVPMVASTAWLLLVKRFR